MRISDWSSDVCSSDLVLEWLHARAAPGLGSPGALRLGVTRVFQGQPELSAAASGMTPGLFPPVTTDGNMVRVLSCSGGRTEWVYRANEGQWILQHYAATGDEPCGVRSEEHTYELQSLMRITSAVFC